MAKAKTITARATVRLSGLNVGETVQVDPTNARVKGLLRSGLLVSEEPLDPVEPRPRRSYREQSAPVKAPAEVLEPSSE